MSLPISQRPKKSLPVPVKSKKKKKQKDIIPVKEFNDKEYWKDAGFSGKDYNLFQ